MAGARDGGELLPSEEADGVTSVHPLILYQQLGRMEGTLRMLVQQFGQHSALAQARWAQEDQRHTADQTRFTSIEGMLGALKVTVDRIRKPVDAFLSMRNFLIGSAALVMAVGALVSGAPHVLLGWITGWFHPNS